jgi:two-component system, NtrC family, response regulator AtoC
LISPVKQRNHIAVLHSDPAQLAYLSDMLNERFKVSLFSQPEEFSQCLDRGVIPDLLMMDWFAGSDSQLDTLALLERLRAHGSLPPLVMLAFSADPKEILAVAHMDAAETLLKPIRKNNIDEAVQHRPDQSIRQDAGDEIKEIPLNENTSFVRSTRRMREIELQCTLIARADIPVLILGESGTGKEVAAMLIHKMSPRNQRSFLKVNCAAMPADLLESELFGYEQGAFTGALKAKPGKFELCDNGTIFLDEIGEMPAALQAKLLQVLQDGSFSRLGGRSTIKVNVRVIAATNIDIKEAITLKRFREDLYYRLNGFTIRMPPLRERIEEIPTLVGHFMRKAAAKYDCEPLPISPALMRALTRHSWPGNLRELENTIRRYLVLRDEGAIIDELAPALASASQIAGPESAGTNLKVFVRNLKGDAEAVAIAKTLEGTGWNRKAAASDLKISYKALLYKIKQYNISPPPRQRSVA